MFTPCTTLAQGIQHLGDPTPKTAKTTAMQIPAKKSKKQIKDENHATDYKPPMDTPVQQQDAQEKRPKQASVYAIPSSMQITDDPLPASRASPVHKYHSVFDQMKYGQSVRCTTADVGKVAGGLRKYLEVKSKRGLVRTMTNYTGDAGHGRVWLLPVALKAAA